jgi:hypothetical protein
MEAKEYKALCETKSGKMKKPKLDSETTSRKASEHLSV